MECKQFPYALCKFEVLLQNYINFLFFEFFGRPFTVYDICFQEKERMSNGFSDTD